MVDTFLFSEEEDTRPKARPPYSPEFRQQMVELMEADRSPEELSREFEPSAQTIRSRSAQGAHDAGRRHDGPTTTEQEEIRRLRREVKQLRLEQEILSKAEAWFARETNATDSRSSRP